MEITKEEVTKKFKCECGSYLKYIQTPDYVMAQTGKEALAAIKERIDANKQELERQLKQLERDEELYNSLVHEGVKRMFANR